MEKSVERAIAQFSLRCDELAESNFILADKKISAVLKTIAGSEFLFNLVRNLLEDFDYEREKGEIMKVGDAVNLSLPSAPDEFIAFVFCLLMDFDNKELDLHKFLQTFFYEDGSYFESFASFCKQIVIPFKNTVSDIAKALLKSEEEERDKAKSTTASELVSKNALENAVRYIMEDRKLIGELNLDEQEKRELYAICDGLLSAIKTLNSELIKTLFLGYKYSLKGLKKFKGNVAKTEKVLGDAKIL